MVEFQGTHWRSYFKGHGHFARPAPVFGLIRASECSTLDLPRRQIAAQYGVFATTELRARGKPFPRAWPSRKAEATGLAPAIEDCRQPLPEFLAKRRHLLRQIDQLTATAYVRGPNGYALNNADQGVDKALPLSCEGR